MHVAVGMVLGVNVDDRHGVVLQVRSEAGSFPRGCQVTSHGKLTFDELQLSEMDGFTSALLRETFEELGPTMAAVVRELLEVSDYPLTLLKRYEDVEQGKLVLTFGLRTSLTMDEFLLKVQPERGVSFKFCANDNSILPLTSDHQHCGALINEVRMFGDEAEAVAEYLAQHCY